MTEPLPASVDLTLLTWEQLQEVGAAAQLAWVKKMGEPIRWPWNAWNEPALWLPLGIDLDAMTPEQLAALAQAQDVEIERRGLGGLT